MKQLVSIKPIYLQRQTKVGEFCVEKWVQQHQLFMENGIGDMREAYSRIGNLQDIFNVALGIQNAAIEIKKGAFVWNIVYEKYMELGISDRRMLQSLRGYFEKYYYEAYLIEYKASILYDFFLIDRGCDFNLKKEYKSITNYMWFESFLRCLGLEKCLDLSAENIVELRYLPQFIKLLDIYVSVCNRDIFENNVRSLMSIVADMQMNNREGINDLAEKVKDTVTKLIMKRSIEYMKVNDKERLRGKVDVLIIIATDEEEKAIISNDNWETKTTEEGYTYFEKVEGKTYAMVRAMDMRETATSIAGQYFIDKLNPTYISMVGFCAGQAGKTQLGDIIVPYKIYRYGMGKKVSNDEKHPEIDSFKIHPVWKQKVERFGEEWRKKSSVKKPIEYEYQRYVFMKKLVEINERLIPTEMWNSDEMPNIPIIIKEFKDKNYIKIESGEITLTKQGKNEIQNILLEKYWDGYKENIPKTKVGVLATGDDVQQWSGIFSELAQKYDRKTIALDMEANAIGNMASFNNKPCLVAKGVGDYAQDNKAFDNRYIEYACHMACRFVIEFFNSLSETELLI